MSIISKFNKSVNENKGRSLSLPAQGRAGARATSSLAAHFAKRNTKFGGGGKARAGKNSFPPTPFLFARPSDWISEFAVRIFVKKSSDFNQKAPPIFRIRILGDCCLAPPKAGLGFGKDFEGIFEIQKQFLPAQTEGRFAEGKHKFEKFINQSFFLSPLAKGKAII